MQVTLSTNHLKKRLQLLTKAQAKWWPLQLDVANGSVRLCGSAESARLALSVKAQRAVGDGVVEFPSFKQFANVVNHLTDPNVTISIGDGAAVVEAGIYRASIDCCWKEALPSDPPGRRIATIDLASLKAVLDRVLFACPLADGRYIRSVVKVESTHGTLKAIATDGHRLAIATVPCQAGTFNFVMPRHGAVLLAQLSGSWLEVSETDGSDANQLLSTDTEQIAVPSVSEFPDYETVLPKEESQTVIVLHKDALLKAIKRLLPVADWDRKEPTIALSAGENSDSLLLHSRCGREAVQATVKGPATSFALEVRLLQQFVRRASGNVTIGVWSPGKPIDFQCHAGGFRFLQIPVNR